MQTLTRSGTPLRFLPLLVLSMLAWAGPSALAQTPAAPQPGPEHKKLAALVGEWTYEGSGVATPFGPANKFKGRETDRLVLNGFFLETRWKETNDAGTVAEGIVLRGFDPSRKAYIDTAFDNEGHQDPGTTTVQGNVWTTLGTRTDAHGKTFQTKYTATVAPGGKSIAIQAEYSADQGKTWMRWYDLTLTKAGA